MKISVSMIVRNEEKMLRTALDSVKDADEIIICDTGSVDDTIAIAREYTDKVFTDYKWNDNFAEARNHAASKCTGDYIFIIDADEHLEEGAFKILREFKGTAVNIRCISTKTGQEHLSLRFYKNIPEIRWEGEVHNFLNVGADHNTDIKLWYDYSPSHEYDKDRSLRILENSLKNDPENQRNLYYVSHEYIIRNRTDEAKAVLEKYITLAGGVPSQELADVHLILAKLKFDANNINATYEHLVQAITINPAFREALFLMGDISTDRNRMVWHRIARSATANNVMFIREAKKTMVTVLSFQDYAGVGQEIVRAVRKYDNGISIDIEEIVIYRTAFGIPSGVQISDLGDAVVQERLDVSDIILFSGDWVYNGDWHGFKLPETAKTIYWTVGSIFRRGNGSATALGTYALDAYVADFKAAGTPELIYGDDWHYIPTAFSFFEKVWKRGKKFRVAHIPSDKKKKGSDIVEKAMNVILAKRKDVEFVNVQGDHLQTLAKKSESHLYLDQFVLPVYGKASIEAMALGVPVITWLDDYKYYDKNIPVQTPDELTAEALAVKIDELLDWDKLQELSDRSFKYVQEVHDKVGERWVEVFNKLME